MDPTFYAVVYGLKDDEDWEDEANWYKVNPSLGYTVDVGNILCWREAFHRAHKQKSLDYVYDNPESISVLLPCENWGALKEVYGIY